MKITQKVSIALTAKELAELLKNTGILKGKFVALPTIEFSKVPEGLGECDAVIFNVAVESETNQDSGLHYPPGVREFSGTFDEKKVDPSLALLYSDEKSFVEQKKFQEGELTDKQVLEDVCRER